MQSIPTPSSTAQLAELLKASGGLGERFTALMEQHLAEMATQRQPAPATQQQGAA